MGLWNMGPVARQVYAVVDGAIRVDEDKPDAARLANFAGIWKDATSTKSASV